MFFGALNSFAVMQGRLADAKASASTVFIAIEDGNRQCTAVVVASHLLLTAGHCTQGASTNGTIEIANDLRGSNKFTLQVTDWKTAPGYRDSDQKEPNEIQYDFAYITVKEDLLRELRISKDQVPKLFATEAELKTVLEAAGDKATGYGYGIFSSSGREGEKREVNLSVALLTDLNVLKATSLETNVGICQGDSGGGLFVKSNDGQTWLLGTVSGIVATAGCGSAKSYAAYTVIYNHICWVQESSGIDLGAKDCAH